MSMEQDIESVPRRSLSVSQMNLKSSTLPLTQSEFKQMPLHISLQTSNLSHPFPLDNNYEGRIWYTRDLGNFEIPF